MALQYATGTFRFLTTDSIGTTKTVTPGFTAKAIRCTWAGRGETVDTIGRATYRRGRGFASSTTEEMCVGTTNLDGAATSTGASVKRIDAIVATISDTGTVDGRANVTSITTTDIVFTVDDVFPVDLVVTWEAWGGDDITNVKVIELNCKTTTGAGSVAYTGVGFQGTMLMTAACDLVTAGNTTDATIVQLTMGACTGAADEHVWYGGEDVGSAAGDTGGACRSGEIHVLAPGTINSPSATGMNARADFTQWDADGFTWNWAEQGRANRRMICMVIKGGSWTVGNFVTRTTVGTIVESGFSYDPLGVSVYSAGRAESAADDLSIHDRLSFGAASSSTNESCHAMLDEDGPTVMEITTAVDYNAVYVNIDTASAIEGEIELQSLDTGGFTLNQNNADAAAYFAWYEAFGSTPAVSASPKLEPMRIVRSW